jgi:hypothetical protein
LMIFCSVFIATSPGLAPSGSLSENVRSSLS